MTEHIINIKNMMDKKEKEIKEIFGDIEFNKLRLQELEKNSSLRLHSCYSKYNELKKIYDGLSKGLNNEN